MTRIRIRSGCDRGSSRTVADSTAHVQCLGRHPPANTRTDRSWCPTGRGPRGAVRRHRRARPRFDVERVAGRFRWSTTLARSWATSPRGLQAADQPIADCSQHGCMWHRGLSQGATRRHPCWPSRGKPTGRSTGGKAMLCRCRFVMASAFSVPTCHQGLQFYPDRAAAVVQMRQALVSCPSLPELCDGRGRGPVLQQPPAPLARPNRPTHLEPTQLALFDPAVHGHERHAKHAREVFRVSERRQRPADEYDRLGIRLISSSYVIRVTIRGPHAWRSRFTEWPDLAAATRRRPTCLKPAAWSVRRLDAHPTRWSQVRPL